MMIDTTEKTAANDTDVDDSLQREQAEEESKTATDLD